MNRSLPSTDGPIRFVRRPRGMRLCAPDPMSARVARALRRLEVRRRRKICIFVAVMPKCRRLIVGHPIGCRQVKICSSSSGRLKGLNLVGGHLSVPGQCEIQRVPVRRLEVRRRRKICIFVAVMPKCRRLIVGHSIGERQAKIRSSSSGRLNGLNCVGGHLGVPGRCEIQRSPFRRLEVRRLEVRRW
jgi:hypothetical protein